MVGEVDIGIVDREQDGPRSQAGPAVGASKDVVDADDGVALGERVQEVGEAARRGAEEPGRDARVERGDPVERQDRQGVAPSRHESFEHVDHDGGRGTAGRPSHDSGDGHRQAVGGDASRPTIPADPSESSRTAPIRRRRADDNAKPTVFSTSATNGAGSRRANTASIRRPWTDRHHASGLELPVDEPQEGCLEVVAPVDPLDATVALGDGLGQGLAQGVAVDREQQFDPALLRDRGASRRPTDVRLDDQEPAGPLVDLRLHVAKAPVGDAPEERRRDGLCFGAADLLAERARTRVQRPLAQLPGDEGDPRGR